MPFERYEILLPLNYNDGTPIEPEKFQETRRELVEQFGGQDSHAPSVARAIPRLGWLSWVKISTARRA